MLLVQAEIDLRGEGSNARIQPRTRPKSRGSLADFYLERKVFELLQAVPDVRSHPGGRRHVVLGLQGGDTQSQPVSGRTGGCESTLSLHSPASAAVLLDS